MYGKLWTLTNYSSTVQTPQTDFRELCHHLLEALEIQLGDLADANRLCKRARAALAAAQGEAEPKKPSNDDLGLIYHDCCRGCEFMDQVGFEDAARAVLASWGRPTPPAPVPEQVPVSERPWEREGWCDEQGRCWFGSPELFAVDAVWVLRRSNERLSYTIACLPASALPLPTTEEQP